MYCFWVKSDFCTDLRNYTTLLLRFWTSLRILLPLSFIRLISKLLTSPCINQLLKPLSSVRRCLSQNQQSSFTSFLQKGFLGSLSSSFVSYFHPFLDTHNLFSPWFQHMDEACLQSALTYRLGVQFEIVDLLRFPLFVFPIDHQI